MTKYDKSFWEIGKYFLSSRRGVRRMTLKEAPDHHPFTRILEVETGDDKKEKFVIKLLRNRRCGSDKTFSDLHNEIVVQEKLKRFGFETKEYLLLGRDRDNSVASTPFAVSTYIEGRALNTMPKERVLFLFPKILDYLYRFHSITISTSFGYLLRTRKPDARREKVSFGGFESKYLLSDIKRDSLDFNEQEMDELIRTTKILDEANLFCLCHCDVTLSNIIWDGLDIHLIDWCYSHFSEPTYDIAYIIFWLIKFGFIQQAQEMATYSFRRYKAIGFNILPRFLFYLAQKYIEFGRFKEVSYIEAGKMLLRDIPINSLSKLLTIFQNLSDRRKQGQSF